MRNSKAKQLRRVARAITVGMPDRAYLVPHHNGSTFRPHRTVLLADKCTRYVYRTLKKELRNP